MPWPEARKDSCNIAEVTEYCDLRYASNAPDFDGRTTISGVACRPI